MPPAPPNSPAPETHYRRYGFFALAVLLHIAVFYAVCHITIFPATAPVTPDAASFQAATITIPTKPVTPPPPPSSAAALSSIAVPAAPAPVVAITAPTPSTFTMPKIDMTAIQSHMPSLTPSQIPTATPGTLAGGNQAGASNPGTGAAVTGNYDTLNNALLNDGRPGIVLGVYCEGSLPAEDASTFDQIRQQLVTAIGWDITDGRETSSPGIKYGADVPAIAQEPRAFARGKGNDNGINLATDYLTVANTKVKTSVLFEAFDGLPKTSDEAQEKRLAESLNSDIAKYVDYMRTYHIRLCIVSFGGDAYPALAAYVKESGGIILYTHGVPTTEVANEIKDAATAK